MKIGNMELSGITKVMFYRKNLFERMPTGKGGFYWFDAKRCKFISDRDIVEVINGCNNNPKKHVWSHGDTINVIRKDQRETSRSILQAPILRAERTIPLW
jgi:hypothetical protein